MQNISRSFMLFLMLITVMLMSAIGPYPVYADDGIPTDIPVEETVSESSDDGTPTDSSVDETISEPTDEGTPTDAPVEETTSEPVDEGTSSNNADEGIPADVSTTDAATESSDAGEQTAEEQVPAETAAEILEQVPEGTNVVVLDDAGEALPMAAEETAQVIVNSDPMWCPGISLPGEAGCTGGYTTVADLISDLKGTLGTPGVIESGEGTIFFMPSYSIDDVTFDGTVLTQLGALTIQGGWNGSLVGAGYALSGVTTFSVPVTIQNWTNNVFINDIEIVSGVATVNHGLGVATTGNIVLDNVYVHDTIGSGDGAKLSNSSGTGSVNITDSRFNNNEGGNGLQVESSGIITLNTVEASGNLLTGAYLNNCLRLGGECQGNGLVTITSATTNLFNGNGDGLVIDASGGIAMDHAKANGNTLNGAILLSTDTNGTGNVTVAQSEFNSNPNGDGLNITTDGNITLTDVTASDNGTGAVLDTTDGVGTITVNATNPLTSNFTGNDGTGLHAESGSTITLANVVASDNGANGAYLDAASDITVTDSTFNNNVHLNIPTDPGLYAESEDGAITLTNVVANDNEFGAGAVLISNADKEISITGISTFNNNGTHGVQAQNSTGDITLTDVVANGNGVKGAYLTTNGTGKITVMGTDLNPDPAIFASISTFSNNGSYGIYAHSEDNITVTGIEASLNGVKGVYLVASCTCPGNIFIYDGIFIENGAYGIYAQTNEGDIELKHVTVTGDNGVDDGVVGEADNLTDIGAFLRTDNGGHILVENSTFELNTEAGLVIVSSGDDDPLTTADVELVDVTSDQNGGNGAEIYSTYTYDCLCPDEVPVSILVSVDGGVFTNNASGYGLYVLPGPEGNLVFADPPTTSATFFDNNGMDNILLDPLFVPANCAPCNCGECCDPTPPVTPKDPNIVDVPFTGGDPVRQDYEHFSSTILRLPNGTTTQINFPFEGSSNLEGLLEKDLPGRLGAGTNFIEGINVSLTDINGNPSPDGNGTITISFKIPEDSQGSYSILFWDPTLNDGVGGWVQLPVYEAGTSFLLNPDDPEDARTVISGVQQIGDTLTVTVNFSGIFVMVSR